MTALIRLVRLVLLVALLWVSPAQAVVAVRTSVQGGGTASTSDRTVTITPASGDLLVIFFHVAANTNDTPSVSDNNSDTSTWSLIRVAKKAASADRVALFVRDKLMVNTTSTVVTAVTGANDAGNLVVVALSGMSRVGSSAVRQSQMQENAADATPAPAFDAAALTSNVILAGCGNNLTTAQTTQPATFTELQDTAIATPTTQMEVSHKTTGFTGTTVTWGGSVAGAFAAIIVEIEVSAASADATNFLKRRVN